MIIQVWKIYWCLGINWNILNCMDLIKSMHCDVFEFSSTWNPGIYIIADIVLTFQTPFKEIVTALVIFKV